EETLGRCVYDLGNGQWDLPELRELLDVILPERTTFEGYEVEHAFERVGRRVMRLNARRLDEHGLILLALEDVTARRDIEAALRECEERYRLLVEGTREYAMLMLDVDGQITTWNTGAERIFGFTEAEALGRS